MELAAAKMIGAGLAMIALLGVGIGIGNIFGSLISSIARNPSAQPEMFKMGLIGVAFTEAIALFALVIAFIILFV
ncbi:MAG: F0F1 ATP synthase subunit C [Alphaproteobacteria bacterium]|nr:F0F1 ATP synthase subunit C [Alphaproteobacteria bacterium]